MPQSLVFSSETNFKFFSWKSAVDCCDEFSVLVSKSNVLVFQDRRLGSEKVSCPLKERIDFVLDEWVRVVKILSENQVLLITSKLRIFSLTLNFQEGRIETFSPVSFRYGSNLSGETCGLKVVEKKQLIFLIADHILFEISKTNLKFRVFKLFSEPIIDVVFPNENPLEMIVLTSKRLFLLQASLVKDTYSSNVLFQTPVNARSISATRNGAILLLWDQCFQCFEREGLRMSSKLGFSHSNLSHKLTHLASIDDTLLMISKEFAYIISKDLSAIEYVLNIKNLDYVSIGNRVFDLRGSSEGPKLLGEIQKIDFTEESKIDRFLEFSQREKLELVSSYLSKQFFALKEIKGHTEIVHELLSNLNLEGCLLRHPKLKEHMIRFYSTVKAFTHTCSESQIALKLKPLSLLNLSERKRSASMPRVSALSPESHKLIDSLEFSSNRSVKVEEKSEPTSNSNSSSFVSEESDDLDKSPTFDTRTEDTGLQAKITEKFEVKNSDFEETSRANCCQKLRRNSGAFSFI